MSILWDCGEKQGAHVNPPPVTREEAPEAPPEPMEGDPDWTEIEIEVAALRAAVERLARAVEARR